MLTLFMVFSITLFNGCYTNYRRIKARNLAIDRAVYHVENILRQNSDELTGFFTRDSENNLVANPIFLDEAYDAFNMDRYTRYKGPGETDIEKPSKHSKEYADYLLYDKNYYINRYIATHSASATNQELEEGDYCFFKQLDNGNFEASNKIQIILDNQSAFDLNDANEYITSNNGAVRVVKTIQRIPVDGVSVFGNNVLRIRVDVYYTHAFKRNARIEDMEVLTINTIKVSR